MAKEKTEGYVIGARGAKYTGKEGTKHGLNGDGTQGTWNAVCAEVKKLGGTITRAQLATVCNAHADKGYTTYCLRNNWLVPSA